MKMFKVIWFALHLIVGLYLINLKFNFVDLGVISSFGDWIVFAGGVLVIISGVMHLLKKEAE